MSSTANKLVIEGCLCSEIKTSTSPAGLVNSKFSIEHRSIQTEQDLNRQAYVRIVVVTSGLGFANFLSTLQQGDALQVSGFLNRHENKHGQPLLALHAQQINKLN